MKWVFAILFVLQLPPTMYGVYRFAQDSVLNRFGHDYMQETAQKPDMIASWLLAGNTK